MSVLAVQFNLGPRNMMLGRAVGELLNFDDFLARLSILVFHEPTIRLGHIFNKKYTNPGQNDICPVKRSRKKVVGKAQPIILSPGDDIYIQKA